MKIGEFYQSGDWKGEKHVPFIEAPAEVTAGDLFHVKLSIGESAAHPNTFEHHIQNINLYFKPEGFNFPILLGSYQFQGHGEHECFAEPHVHATIRIKESGTLIATSYCNIHGLWENSQDIKVK